MSEEIREAEPVEEMAVVVDFPALIWLDGIRCIWLLSGPVFKGGFGSSVCPTFNMRKVKLLTPDKSKVIRHVEGRNVWRMEIISPSTGELTPLAEYTCTQTTHFEKLRAL